MKMKIIKNNDNLSTSQSHDRHPCICKVNSSFQHCLLHDSTIGQHLLDNTQCALRYSDKIFSLFTRVCSTFHLSALEASLTLFYVNKNILFIGL